MSTTEHEQLPPLRAAVKALDEAAADVGGCPTQLPTGGLTYEADAARDTESALGDLQPRLRLPQHPRP